MGKRWWGTSDRDVDANKHKEPKTGNTSKREELTGFDGEGYGVSAVFVGGIAESSDVRGDLDTDHAVNPILGFFFGCCLDNLAQKHTMKDVEKKRRSHKRKGFPFSCTDVKS